MLYTGIYVIYVSHFPHFEILASFPRSQSMKWPFEHLLVWSLTKWYTVPSPRAESPSAQHSNSCLALGIQLHEAKERPSQSFWSQLPFPLVCMIFFFFKYCLFLANEQEMLSEHISLVFTLSLSGTLKSPFKIILPSGFRVSPSHLHIQEIRPVIHI